MDKWAVELASTIKEETKISAGSKTQDFIIGTVEGEAPNLLISDGPEIIIFQEDLYILESVLANYERSVEYDQAHDTTTGKLRFTDTLKKGDKVALIPSSGTMYILLGKVVQL